MRITGVIRKLQNTFNTVHVGAECYTFDACFVFCIYQMADNIFYCSKAVFASKKNIIKVYPDNASRISESAELIVCQIPGMILQRTTATVARRKRLFLPQASSAT